MAYPNAPPPPGQAPQYGPGAVNQCMSKVELRIECHNLLNMDVTSKSDPCAVLYMQRAGKHWYEAGRTENIKNTLDPQFSKSFLVEYFFEEVQKIKIGIYDIDNQTPQMEDDDFLGGMECTLGSIVACTPYKKPLVLKNGQPAGRGSIIVRAEEQTGNNEFIHLDFSAKGLDNKDFMGKSDPMLEVHRINPDGTVMLLHRTEVVKNNLNPNWRVFKLPLRSLRDATSEYNLDMQIHDWDSDGSHDFIGGFGTTLSQLLSAGKSPLEWPCMNPKKQAKKKSYKNSGVAILKSATIVKEHSFLDFIFGGLQINFTVGIDFTGSNGNPANPTSLHYINPYQPNEYQQAIGSVGAVCQDYDTDKLFPALGFGARIPPSMQLSHEFAINFNMQNPFCAGVQGILEAYRNCVPQIALYGPTNVAPIVRHVTRFAYEAKQSEQHSYFVLLLLTDGVVTDMNDTRQAIVEASSLPMSLIIVGVGDADFSDMELLDGDDGVLRAPNGRPVVRDIVQFVPYRQFRNASAAELARHVLAEIPRQVTGYHAMMKIAPRAPQNPA